MDNSDMIKDVIKLKTGNEPQIHEPTCILWKSDHENCKGCPSDLPCSMMVSIMMVTVRSSMYEPKSFEDFLSKEKHTSNLMDKILDAKTTDDIHSII